MNIKFKKWHLFEIEIFCNIMNVFTVICDQFKTLTEYKCFSLSLKRNRTDPSFWNDSMLKIKLITYFKDSILQSSVTITPTSHLW